MTKRNNARFLSRIAEIPTEQTRQYAEISMAKKIKQCWIGFDLGGTKMMGAVYNDALECLGRKRRKTRARDGAKAGMKRIVETIETACSEAGISTKEIQGIGLGIPGLLDLDNGTILDAPNLGWENVPIRKELESAFNTPVTIANDVDAGVFGEYYHGAAVHARCVVGLFPGTGIGGGCIYEGKIIRGRRNSCMEIGHVQVMPNGPLCGCGKRGCLEAVASRLAIAAEAAKAVFRGEAPHLLEIAGPNLTAIRSGALAAAISAGDKAVEAIVRDAAKWIGVAAANAINLLAPDVIVLGGGLVEAMPEIFAEAVEETSRERVMPAYRDTYSIAVARLGDDAAVIGAAAWAKSMNKR
jgi:glucokinase